MNGRLICRLVLAFALLWSQQAALSHAISHAQTASRAPATAFKPGKPLLKDRACLDCLAHAQLFSALAGAERALGAVKPALLPLDVPGTADACLLTVCMFQSRAPPAA